MMLLVFDSHPVQYRVPVWRGIERRKPGAVHVVYASDCSVRGHLDEGFGRTVAWDEPMLDGYPSTILKCEKGRPLAGWGSLTGAGVSELISRFRPRAVLLTGLNYRYDLVAYRQARRRGIPVWLRCETQDEAVRRPAWKSALRSAIYRVAYRGLDRAFYIGELNRRHYLHHGVPESRLRPARYGTVDRFADMGEGTKLRLREDARRQAEIGSEKFVVGFSGKFIPKKNPDLLFAMLEFLPETLRRRTCVYFLGSGEMEARLRNLAGEAHGRFGVRTWFAGFANQSELAGHYLAMDVLALPSRRMGETWGLVANEAMQAGCGAVVSEAVGCGADFGPWDRFRVFPEGNAAGLANAVAELADYSRDFDWATKGLRPHAIEATEEALVKELEEQTGQL